MPESNNKFIIRQFANWRADRENSGKLTSLAIGRRRVGAPLVAGQINQGELAVKAGASAGSENDLKYGV